MTSLVSIAEQLLAQAKELESTLEKNGIPYTSFENDTLEQLPQDAQRLRSDLVDTSDVLRQLARGARPSGIDLSISWTDQLVLRIVSRYQLASAVPLDGSATYDELAAASGLTPSLIARVIRAAIPLRIFDERSPGHVSQTALSRLLATDAEYASWIAMQLEDFAPAGRHLPEVWDRLGTDAGDPEQSAFAAENGGRPLYAVTEGDRARGRRLNSAMKCFVASTDFGFGHVAEAFDWSSLDAPGARVVDLGGGTGKICQDLARATRHVSFVVQDLASVVEDGERQLPAELRNRVSFEAHDFFRPQGDDATPASAYLICRCLHDFSDRHCVTILRGLVPAMRRGSKVLLWDMVLPDEPVRKMSERYCLQQDLMMAVVANGKDRTAEELKRLVAQSDPRFVVGAINRPEGCLLSMVVVTWEG